MKLIVCGGRSISETPHRISLLSDVVTYYGVTEIISGGASGGDRIGEDFAQKHGIAIQRFPAKWDIHGRRAGFLRNLQMADYVGTDGMVLAFSGGRGTQLMKDIAASHGLDVIEE